MQGIQLSTCRSLDCINLYPDPQCLISTNTLNGCSVTSTLWSVYSEYLQCLV